MKNIYQILVLMFFFVTVVNAQEEKEIDKEIPKEEKAIEKETEEETEEEIDVPEKEIQYISASEQSKLEIFKTNILGSILADFKDKLEKKRPKQKAKLGVPLVRKRDTVLLEKYTFFLESEELNPDFMIDWCFSVHDLSDKSYTYSEKYKKFCKTLNRKDLEKLRGIEIIQEQTNWEEDAVASLNERLNIRDREVSQILEKLKAKKKAKKNKKKEKTKRKAEKKRKKAEKERDKNKKEGKEKDDNSIDEKEVEESSPIPDEEMVRLIQDGVVEGKIVLKVGEPIFTKNRHKAIVLVTETENNIVTIYIKVLKKSKGQRWCITGEIQAERNSKDLSKFKKRKIIVNEFEDDGVNFVDGKKLSEEYRKKMIEKNKSAKMTRLSSVPGAHIVLDDNKKYNFSFKDVTSEKEEFVSFSFRGPETSDFKDIFNAIKAGFKTSVTDETVKFKANGELIGMKYLKKNGTGVVQFVKYNENTRPTSREFTKKEIERLFQNEGNIDTAKSDIKKEGENLKDDTKTENKEEEKVDQKKDVEVEEKDSENLKKK